MAQFSLIARHYDDLMAGVGYRHWVSYVEEILARIDPSFAPPYKGGEGGVRTVLDVACGTGNVSELLAAHGFEVVGVDISPDMIDIARAKKGRVEYHVHDIAELDLRGHPDRPPRRSERPPRRSERSEESRRTFDLAVCLFDSLNYVTDPDHLARAIKRIGEHLNPGGVFIFDINTIYALAHRFFDQASLTPDRYPKYVWSSEYDHETRICRIDMLFEVLEDGGTRQFKEVHYQRGHTIEELTQWLVDGGFEVVDIFHAYKFRKPTRRSDRVFFVARRRD